MSAEVGKIWPAARKVYFYCLQMFSKPIFVNIISHVWTNINKFKDRSFLTESNLHYVFLTDEQFRILTTADLGKIMSHVINSLINCSAILTQQRNI